MMDNSIERIVPDLAETNEATGKESLLLHIERYRFAGKHLQKGVVADIACGSGYGSFLLATQYSDKAIKILAADNNEKIVGYAKIRYDHPAINFLLADITQFIPHIELQNIVCLETLEHLADPLSFIRHVSGFLQKEGIFIASVPVTPSMDANPFHLHDFTASSFRKMFVKEGFSEIAVMEQVQRYKIQDVLFKKEKRTADTRRGLLKYYARHPDKFFLRIWSLLSDGFTNKYIVVAFQKE